MGFMVACIQAKTRPSSQSMTSWCCRRIRKSSNSTLMKPPPPCTFNSRKHTSHSYQENFTKSHKKKKNEKHGSFSFYLYKVLFFFIKLFDYSQVKDSSIGKKWSRNRTADWNEGEVSLKVWKNKKNVKEMKTKFVG